MSRVTVWKSDLDGKLFEHKSVYVKHLRKLAKERMFERKANKHKQEFEAFNQRMGQVTSVKELERFIRDNWSWFYLNGVIQRSWSRTSSGPHELLELSINVSHLVDKVSNSHGCPRGGVRNFTQVSYINGYPGWRGSIKFKVKTPEYSYKGKLVNEDGFGSSYFSNTILHTGSGSSCGQGSFQYEFYFFGADFPIMYEAQGRINGLAKINHERIIMWSRLGGKIWPDPLTELPDDWQLPDPLA